MKLTPVDPRFVDSAWREGAHKLSEACATSGGEITGDQLKLLLSRNERILLRMEEGIVGEVRPLPDGSFSNYETRTVGWGVVRIDQLPNVRVLHACEMYAPGIGFERFFGALKELAINAGCSEVRCSAAPAQARLYQMKCGFEPIYTTLRVSVYEA
jgi:hypothetical protein